MPTSATKLFEYNNLMELTAEQRSIINRPQTSKIFLAGPAGTGKTTVGVHRLKKLVKSGIPPHEILIFVPQRNLATPYQEGLRDLEEHSPGVPASLTFGGLARRMVNLFWPFVSQKIGVAEPEKPPHFLTLETAQYYMAHLVRPLIEEEGYFQSLTINHNRIYSQILDNLNKAAIVGFPFTEISQQLKSAWVGDIEQLNIYDDAQHCIELFREYCLANNLLDFSLQVEIFVKHLWGSPLCRNYLTETYRHLIIDNIEEDTPISHDVLREWIPDFESALVIFDEDAGFRYFLGADVASALSLRNLFDTRVSFKKNLIANESIRSLQNGVQNALAKLNADPPQAPRPTFEELQAGLKIPEENLKYFPAMVRWVTDKIVTLMEEGTSPSEIVVLAPFMPDVLRFSLSKQLDNIGIPNRAHRPSRSLRDEPTTQTMLTLATIAFPVWELLPQRINLAFTLMQVIEGLDLVRAQLLTAYCYQQGETKAPLRPFEIVPAEIKDRITYQVGERYDRLREWLEAAPGENEVRLDFFLSRLFGEVLSQPGFRYQEDLSSGNTIAMLIESIQKFRWAVRDQITTSPLALGKEYIQMVQDGVIAAQYIHAWEEQDQEAVFLAPAYTFLIRNKPVDYQFWLDVGSPAWYQRLEQPLTQPYVLSREWEKGATWTAEDELNAAQLTLKRLTLGLLNRCRKKVFLGMSELDVRGYENRGLLLRVLNNVLQNARRGQHG